MHSTLNNDGMFEQLERERQIDRRRCPEATCSGDAPDFITELRELLNRRSMENGSDTPDFILAQYLADCLRAWNRATKRREDWYGRTPQEVSSPNSQDQASDRID